MKLLSALAVGLMLAGPVSAQDFEKGLAAGRAGDYATAMQELRPLADQGNGRAQYFLGMMYLNGQGVPQDYVEALKWHRLAAAQGVAMAQNDLAVMYELGQGVLQDYVEALKWFRSAAAQGVAMTQTNLGLMYFKGLGVPQDNVTAHMWFNIAAASGNEDGKKYREQIAEKMTPADITEAQRRARVCLASNYQDCD